MDLNSTWGNDKKVKALTGLSRDQLLEISGLFFETIKRKQASRGRPRKLSDENLLLLLLSQYKHNVTYELLGVIFDIDLSNTKRWIDRLDEVLQDVLKKKNYCHLIPKGPRNKQSNDFSIVNLYALMGKNNRSNAL